MSFEHVSVLKLYRHITVLWCFCKIPMTFEFLFLGLGLKTKPANHGNFVFFRFFFSGYIEWIFVYIFP